MTQTFFPQNVNDMNFARTQEFVAEFFGTRPRCCRPRERLSIYGAAVHPKFG
jgi:hypothetical protein